MMTTEDRQSELARLSRLLESGNYGPNTIARFRELVAAEARQHIDAAMPRIMAERRRREANRRAAVAAGQRAGMEAGWRYVERLRRGGRR